MGLGFFILFLHTRMNWEHCSHSLTPKEAHTFPTYRSPGGIYEDKALPHLWQFSFCRNLLFIVQRQKLEKAWSFQHTGWRLIPMWNFMLILRTPGEKLLLVWMRKLRGSRSYGPQTNSFWWLTTKLPGKWRCWRSNSSSSSEKLYHASPGSVLLHTVFILNEKSTGDIAKQCHSHLPVTPHPSNGINMRLKWMQYA